MLAGRLILVTEQNLDVAGIHRSFLIEDGRMDHVFDVSDCAILLPNSLRLRERRFSIARCLAVCIRHDGRHQTGRRRSTGRH